MLVVVSQIRADNATIDVHTPSEVKTITLSRVGRAIEWDDFSDWGLSRIHFKDLNKLVDEVIDEMDGKPRSSLNIVYEMGEMD